MQIINKNEGKIKSLALAVVLLIAIALGVFVFQGNQGLDLLNSGGKHPNQASVSEQKTPDKPAAGKPGENEVTIKLTYNLDQREIEKIISAVDEEQRKAILADAESFQKFVKNEAANKSLLKAAHANNIDSDEKNLYIAQRAAENILREIYLRKLLASKIPADFPTDDQVTDYYEKNKDSFTLEERVPVWQIFLPIGENKDTKDWELLKKQAESIITDINKGKMDFGTAARKFSKPLNTKYTDGYMGIVKLSEIKPEIKATLLSAPPDSISQPIKTDDGIHIIKRGEIIPKQQIKLDEVKPQIIKTMKTQLAKQLSAAVFKQATESYPVDLDDKTIEEWRLKIRTGTNSDESDTPKNDTTQP